MSKAWLVRFSLAVSVGAVAALSFVGSATAAQITVGQVAPPMALLQNCETTGFDEAQKTVAEGAS